MSIPGGGKFMLLMAVIFLCGFCIFEPIASGQENTPARGPESNSLQSSDYLKIVEILEQQKTVYLHEMGQLKREVAALRQEMTNPGLRDVVAGIGYIFGLTGVTLYVATKKEKR